MEPVIKNYRNMFTPDGPAVRLVGADDNAPTCTMSYTEIAPDAISAHHIHPWEHSIYILNGSGTIVCDGKEYQIKEGDAIFVPGEVNHYTLNNGGQGTIRRLEINPLSAQAGGARVGAEMGVGKAPMIRNFRGLSSGPGSRLIGKSDGVPNTVLLYNGAMAPGSVSHTESGGHTHVWEHLSYILEGEGALSCDGKEYRVAEGDAVLVPPDLHHQWLNPSSAPMVRITFNPLYSDEAQGIA
jgi:quercetin dioxygenase-like cupin family protein